MSPSVLRLFLQCCQDNMHIFFTSSHHLCLIELFFTLMFLFYIWVDKYGFVHVSFFFTRAIFSVFPDQEQNDGSLNHCNPPQPLSLRPPADMALKSSLHVCPLVQSGAESLTEKLEQHLKHRQSSASFVRWNECKVLTRRADERYLKSLGPNFKY